MSALARYLASISSDVVKEYTVRCSNPRTPASHRLNNALRFSPAMEELEREMRGLGPRKGSSNTNVAGAGSGLVTNNKILQMKPPGTPPPEAKPAAAAAPKGPAQRTRIAA